MISIMALCILWATVAYGAVTPELAAPVYGLAILLAVLWAAKLFFARVVSWKQSPMHWPVLGFAVYAIIRYFTAPVEYEARLELFQVGLCTLVYFLTACNFYRQRDRTLLLAVLMALALAEAAYGLWQFATRSKYVLFSHRPAQYQHRASGTFVCPNHLAGFLEIMLGMLLARLVVHKVSKGTVQTSALQKVLIAYIGLMILVGIVLTLSRAGWLAILVGLLALLFWGDWRLRVMWPRILAGVGCIGVLAIIAFNVAPVRNYITYSLSFDQADAPTGVRDVSLGGRTAMWGSTAKMIVDHPIFGTGPGSWQWFHLKYRNPRIQTHAEYAHNDILNLASDYGLIGFGLVAAAIICFFRHVALLTGGACVDGVLGGHTLDQGSAYSFRHGFNGAARDPLQHALPLVYLEPDLALSVLRNTCAWGSPDGDLPYALDGRKQPWTQVFRPSDQNLWALWLAAEYAAATGDLAAFAEPVPYHPVHRVESVSLAENLRRQFRFFVDEVGLGEHGHVRMLNADWNDLAISESGVDRELMVERGESVLNSAMAAWVLPVYAALTERLGDQVTAAAARTYAEDLRLRVADEWNGRWFRRAYGPGATVGDDSLWLEVQPWAILCGAAGPERARALLAMIDETCRAGSPLGARIRRPGPIWLSINMTLIWAAARHDPDLAWDEWRRMSLHAHSTAYPGIWSGVLSGPDSYLEPESARPGETWVLPDLGAAMQAYPVANLHSHAQPLLGYLRLLGVEPTADGRLRCGGGGFFASRTLTVRPDGSGRLTTAGDVEVLHRGGRTGWATGELTWGNPDCP